MAGLNFLKTKNLDKMINFYTKEVGMNVWLKQAHCAILQHENFLLGFCEKDEKPDKPIVTIFYPETKEVDKRYNQFKEFALDAPKENPMYNIYHFFMKDPEGRLLEFQTFLHPVLPYLDGVSLLKTRRSIRKYQDKVIPKEILNQIFESCRFSPTSMNTQSYYYVITDNKTKIKQLSNIRGNATAPFVSSPYAVAVCIDPSKTKRHLEDGHIAAYHFILAANMFGLGTCWIADMDRENVKSIMEIPDNHFVATVMPLGYPDEVKGIPERREIVEFVRKI